MNTISIRSGPSIISLSLKNTALSLEQPNGESVVRCTRNLFSMSHVKQVGHQEIPYRNVIDASFDTKTRLVKVTYLYKTKKKNPFLLSVTEGQVEVAEIRLTSEWVEALMNASYAGNSFESPNPVNPRLSSIVGVPRSRRLLIFLNPHGGTVWNYFEHSERDSR
jgi:hypothetical protein